MSHEQPVCATACRGADAVWLFVTGTRHCTRCELPSTSLEVGCAALDEGADAFGRVSASQHRLVPVKQHLRCRVAGCALGGARGRERGLHRERSVRGDQPGDFDGPVQVAGLPARLSLTRPALSAASASKRSAVSRYRMPAAPSRAGNRNVAPPKGKIPRATSSCAKRVPSAATASCDASASSIPERVASPVHRNHDRLRARLAEEVPRIQAVFGEHAHRRHRWRPADPPTPSRVRP